MNALRVDPPQPPFKRGEKIFSELLVSYYRLEYGVLCGLDFSPETGFGLLF